jgi:hypothetical protein
MLYNGRRPDIKDGIGFQQGNQPNVKLNAEREMCPWAISINCFGD